MVLDCIFDLPFSNKYQCWYLLMCLLVICMSLRKVSVFSLFLHWLFLQFLLLLLFNSMIKPILLLEKQSRFTHLRQVYLMEIDLNYLASEIKSTYIFLESIFSQGISDSSIFYKCIFFFFKRLLGFYLFFLNS